MQNKQRYNVMLDPIQVQRIDAYAKEMNISRSNLLTFFIYNGLDALDKANECIRLATESNIELDPDTMRVSFSSHPIINKSKKK